MTWKIEVEAISRVKRTGKVYLYTTCYLRSVLGYFHFHHNEHESRFKCDYGRLIVTPKMHEYRTYAGWKRAVKKYYGYEVENGK